MKQNNNFRNTTIAIFLLGSITVAAQTPVLVKDIYSGSNNSNPEQLTDVNGTLFFVATTGTSGTGTGKELYKSNGTSAGTTLVKDIYVGGNSNPANLTNWNGTLYFTATDATHGTELWKTDGTTAGTVLVKDIAASTASSNPANLIVFNNALYFVADDGASGYELWKTDGTEAGTAIVTDLYTGSTDAFPSSATSRHFAIMGSYLYFMAQGSNSTGYELWRTNGTAGGTTLVKDIYTGSGHGYPNHLKNVNNTLYFWAKTSVAGYELWKSDGTESGTVMIKDIYPGSSDSGWAFNSYNNNSSTTSTPDFFLFGGNVYFTAQDGSTGYELWKTDGTVAGTVQVKDLKPGTGSSYTGGGYTYNNGYSGLTLFKNELYFSSEDGTAQPYHGSELWKTNGTEAGTVMVKDIVAGTGDSTPEFFTIYNNTLYFAAGSGSSTRVLWKTTDGTEASTISISGILNPNYLTVSNGILYFSAYASSGSVGTELYRFDMQLGTDETNKAKSITLYPNPVKDILNFSEEVSDVKVADLSGKMVKQVSAKGKMVDISTLPKGVYIISATTREGKANHQKIIKE